MGRQLGYDPFRPGAEKRVSVEITRTASGLEGRLGWSDAAGRWAGDRRFSSRKADCGELAAGMMFSAAVQIQLLSALSPPPPVPPGLAAGRGAAGVRPGTAGVRSGPTAAAPGDAAPVASAPAEQAASEPPAPGRPPSAPIAEERPAAPVTATAPARVPPTSPLSDARLVLGAGVGVALAVGVAPGPSGLGRLFLGARRGRLSVELGAAATLPVTEQQPDGTAFVLDTQAADAMGCAHVGVLAGCVVGRIGRIHARGSGVEAPRSPAGLFSQVGARLAAAHDLGGRYFAVGHVDGLVMLSPWTVALNGGAVWTTPRFGVLLGVDLGARFF